MTFLKRLAPRFLIVLLTALWIGQSHALNPLFDGGFESGTLQGWVPGTSGTAIVASRATCFSDTDTTAISIRGRYAGLLRSIKDTEPASLTSKPFIAGDSIVFLALSEQLGDTPKRHPFALNVSILDGGGTVLNTKAMSTALAQLSKGCPSATGDASFGQHFISTRAYAGKQIRLRFSHHPDLAKKGAFTLIDEVSIVDRGEVPIFQSFPIAKAGFSFDENHLFLLPGLPDGDVEQTRNWQFSWLINGESSRRPYFNPCIDDLEPGDYTANLFVRQNDKLVTDTLYFSVPYIIFSQTPIDQEVASGSATTIDDDSDDDIICNARHPLDVPSIVEGDGGDDGGNDGGNDGSTGPVISGLTLNDPLTSNGKDAIDLIAKLDISSDSNLKSAQITLNPSQTGDKFVVPTVSELQGLVFTCASDTSCSLTGNALASVYTSVFQGLNIILAANESSRTVSIIVTDADDKSSSAASASFTPKLSSEAPVISGLLLNTPFVANATATILIANLDISAGLGIKSAQITLNPAQPGDKLIPPDISELGGLSVTCSSDTTCTLSIDAAASLYKTAIQGIDIDLGPSGGTRTVTITVTDTANQISNTASASFTAAP